MNENMSENKDLLIKYIYFVDRLVETNFIKTNFNPSFSISWDKISNQMRNNLRRPDDEYFKSFLLDFRKFYSNDEIIFVSKIHNYLMQKLSSDTLKEQIIKGKENWKKSTRINSTYINNENVTPETAYKLIINAFYFHVDVDKMDKLLSFGEIGMNLSYFWFYNYVLDGFAYIILGLD